MELLSCVLAPVVLEDSVVNEKAGTLVALIQDAFEIPATIRQPHVKAFSAQFKTDVLVITPFRAAAGFSRSHHLSRSFLSLIFW